MPEETQGFGRLLAMIVEATFAAEEQDLDRAVEIFTAALDRAEKEQANPSPYVWRALYGRALALWKRGDLQLAKENFLAAQSALELLSQRAPISAALSCF